MSGTGSPPMTPIDEPPPPDFDDRDVLEQLIKQNYMRLVNRINIRDFLPRLREKGFTLGDQQEVQHMVTSVDKASTLIDLVLRKDRACLQAFMEVLEYDCEDLYLKITGVRARERPDSWVQVRQASRNSMQALTGIMETMSGILSTLTKNHNTMQNLASQVQGVWTKTSQEQMNEEQNLVKLKETLDRLKAENATVMWQNKVLKGRLDNERKKTKKLSSADERLLQLRKELRDKEEQLQQIESETTVDRTTSQVTVLEQRLRTLTGQNIEMERDLRNEQDDNKRMQVELEETEKQIKQQTDRIDDLSEENLSLRTKLDELENHCYWLERKEKRQQNLDHQLYGTRHTRRENADGQDDAGYVDIPMTHRDLLRIPSVDGQSRTTITADLDRLSRNLSENLCLTDDINLNYRQEILDVSDLIQNADFIPQGGVRGNISTVEVEGSEILKAITLAGGNHCGIFISSIKNHELDRSKVKIGDHLMKIQPNRGDDNGSICLGDCTLEEAHTLLEKQKGRVQLFLWSGGELYKKFMNRRNKDYKGDLFCIQMNKTSSITVGGREHPLEAGDVLLVLDTFVSCGNPRKWFVRKLSNGKWQDPKLPSHFDPIKKTQRKLSASRGKTVETKDAYSYVKPYTPYYARPVLLFGENYLLTRLLEVAAPDPQFKLYNMKDTRQGTPGEKIMNQMVLCERMHIILEGTQEMLKDLMKRKIYPIVVRVKSEMGSSLAQDPLKDIPLPRCGIEELELTQNNLLVKEGLLKLLKTLITQTQRHLIWLEKKHPSLPIH